MWGPCCHIVTANEYLAARDATWMKPLYDALGLTIGLIVPGQSLAQRIEQYNRDVVYATAREIVFDSLREPIRNSRSDPAEAILRPARQNRLNPTYDFAIIDEIDSVLIDQARSPLSIGAAATISPQIALYRHADEIAGRLTRGAHYRLMRDDRQVELKDEGKAAARAMAGEIWRLLPPGHNWERYVVCALAARYIYRVNEQYVVSDGRIVLIDESTGRLLPARQLPDGIHQAIEVRNGIAPSTEIKGNYQTTFQTFFRKYDDLAGMTGTAMKSAWEFMAVYDLGIIPVPPNRPILRAIHPDRVYRSMKAKYQAVLDFIQEIHNQGRPLLIATGSVQISEKISSVLTQAGFEHEVLNAKNHAREAEIIAQAGHAGKITIITNMAGRGVDIKLGPDVADMGGVCLISTDRLHYRRLDDQLTGRVGRQGDPGDCHFFLSLHDELMQYVPKKKIIRLRLGGRADRHAPLADKAAARLFRKIQGHIDAVTRKQRHRVFQGEKFREKLRKEGLWEDWMDAS